jgi:septal ring factor EnvC (AmiA/AmiB activator)
MEEEGRKSNKLDEIHNTLKIVMKKLDKLDVIEGRMKTLEEDLRDVKTSMKYAHAQITDLKTSHEITMTFNKETKDRLDKLEKENADLNNGIIDLKARSMRDNLIFYNLPEIEPENMTKREGNSKLRPIVAKFNYHQDK